MEHTAQAEPRIDRDGRRRIIVVIAYSLSQLAVLFIAAGTFQWPAAWARGAVWLVTFGGASIWLLRKNPTIINERGRARGEVRPWDRVFSWIYAPVLYLLPLVAGLDWRFSWSSMMPAWQILGLLILIPASILPYWAMSVNIFLLPTVQIQQERGHHVISEGPYRIVRHPMYLGGVLVALSEPLLLGSWWALIPGLIAVAALFYRTSMEDRTLRAELPGYTEFAARTRYRILPGIW